MLANSALQRLICVYTVCLGPNGTRGLINCKMFTDMTGVVRVSRLSKASRVNNNVYFYIKCSSCVLSDRNKQLFSPKLKKHFFNGLKGFGILQAGPKMM